MKNLEKLKPPPFTGNLNSVSSRLCITGAPLVLSKLSSYFQILKTVKVLTTTALAVPGLTYVLLSLAVTLPYNTLTPNASTLGFAAENDKTSP